MKLVALDSLQTTATWPPAPAVTTALTREPPASPPVGCYRPHDAFGCSSMVCGEPTWAPVTVS
jgi:hypothetical protein